jgi:uncharacterized membrane protein
MEMFYAPGVTTQVSTRIAAFDRLRGLIIVLMAIDHASFFIARVHPMETWASTPPYYTDAAWFLTRWITHLCAPGFFLLMGVGLVWFAESRRAAGWTDGRITRYFVTRGLILLGVQHFMENPAWLLGIVSANPAVEAAMPSLPGNGDGVMLAFAVLSALAVAMIVWGVAWRGPVVAQAALIGAALVAGTAMVPEPGAAGGVFPAWKVLLFVPAAGGIIQNLYPWVIWLVPAGFGVVMGGVMRRYTWREPHALPLAVGSALLLAFVLARLAGAGEFARVPAGVIGWLTVTKYPPSLFFFLLMIGLNLVLLAALLKWPGRWLAPLEVYGRTPFFFYLAHLWTFGVLSWAFRDGASLPVMYAVWALTVAILYPACRWYARFKFAKPATSMWRMF